MYTFRSVLDLQPPAALRSLHPRFVQAMAASSAPACVPSVSTVLAGTVPNDGLRFWRAKVGEEEANRVSTTAAARGTFMHATIEKFLLKGGAEAGGKDLMGEGGGESDELLLSMSGIINGIAQHDSR
jgi:hypothetical protein